MKTGETKLMEYKGFKIYEVSFSDMRPWGGEMREFSWSTYSVQNANGEEVGARLQTVSMAKAHCTKLLKRGIDKFNYMTEV